VAFTIDPFGLRGPSEDQGYAIALCRPRRRLPKQKHPQDPMQGGLRSSALEPENPPTSRSSVASARWQTPPTVACSSLGPRTGDERPNPIIHGRKIVERLKPQALGDQRGPESSWWNAGESPRARALRGLRSSRCWNQSSGALSCLKFFANTNQLERQGDPQPECSARVFTQVHAASPPAEGGGQR